MFLSIETHKFSKEKIKFVDCTSNYLGPKCFFFLAKIRYKYPEQKNC